MLNKKKIDFRKNDMKWSTVVFTLEEGFFLPGICIIVCGFQKQCPSESHVVWLQNCVLLVLLLTFFLFLLDSLHYFLLLLLLRFIICFLASWLWENYVFYLCDINLAMHVCRWRCDCFGCVNSLASMVAQETVFTLAHTHVHIHRNTSTHTHTHLHARARTHS